MEIIIGHTNSDLDCMGSMVLAKYLYPQAILVKSRLIHPVARNLYSLYRDHLNMKSIKEIRDAQIEKVIIVDTRTLNRVKEYFDEMDGFTGRVEIWDHHPDDDSNIPNAEIHADNYGANTTLIGMELIRRNITVDEDDATIALAGIYADTGNFTYENVTNADFEVASYLIRHGAKVKMIRGFLKKLSDEHQITLFHEVLNRLVYQNFQGHLVVVSYYEMEKQEGGLAAVVEKVHEIENLDATFAVFHFLKTNSTAIIARSQTEGIPVNEILSKWQGGGHTLAASALIKNSEGPQIHQELMAHLQTQILPAYSAGELMTSEVYFINHSWTLKEASIFLEKIDHTGAPVIDDEKNLVGILTLRDIMKGRKYEQMHAPVSAYMANKPITIPVNATIRIIENLIFKHNIGHLPVMDGREVVGIVTRSDILRFLSMEKKKEDILLENYKALKNA